MEYLFLYGTLLSDEAPDEVLGTLKVLRRLGPAQARGLLYDLGEYPGAVLDQASKKTVHGEIFELPPNEAILKALDQYEEFDPVNKKDSLFVRTKVKAMMPNGSKVDCWIYVYNGDPGTAPLLTDGIYSTTRAA